jgi:hypothetical protein
MAWSGQTVLAVAGRRLSEGLGRSRATAPNTKRADDSGECSSEGECREGLSYVAPVLEREPKHHEDTKVEVDLLPSCSSAPEAWYEYEGAAGVCPRYGRLTYERLADVGEEQVGDAEYQGRADPKQRNLYSRKLLLDGECR